MGGWRTDIPLTIGPFFLGRVLIYAFYRNADEVIWGSGWIQKSKFDKFDMFDVLCPDLFLMFFPN